MEIYTIGFTKKTASEFFGALSDAAIQTLIDVRLNNKSQLAGFTKQADLEYFLSKICGIRYQHELSLARSDEMLKAYRAKKIDWPEYAREYSNLLISRSIENQLSRSDFQDRTVLLCSECEPDQCHRRLAAEHLSDAWEPLKITHL